MLPVLRKVTQSMTQNSTAEPSSTPGSLRLRRIGLGLLALGLGASVAAWGFSAKQQQRVHAERFNAQAQLRIKALHETIGHHIEAARAVAGLFRAQGQVDVLAFHRFCDSVYSADRHPAMVGVNLALMVPAAEWPALRDRLRSTTGSGLNPRVVQALHAIEVRPASTRSTLWPVVMVEPSDPPSDSALAVLGFDLGSDAVRREALERARDSGDILLSPALPINVKELAVRDGVALRAPIYRDGLPLKTVEQRRAAAAGVVSVVMRVRALLEPAAQAVSQSMRLQVRDLDMAAGQDLIYNGPANVPAQTGTMLMSYKSTLPIAGRRWEVEASSSLMPPTWLAGESLAVLLGGLALTAVMGVIGAGLLREHARAEDATQRLHDESRRNALTLRKVLDSTSDAILAVGDDGSIIDCNRSAEELFGYDRKQLLHQRFEDLVPGLSLSNVVGRLDILGHEGGRLASSRVETKIGRADGKVLPVALTVGRMDHEGRECLTLGLVDLSTQRAALAQAREFERLGRTILDSAPYSIMIIRLDGEITGANRATEALLGYGRDELLGKSPRLFHDPEEIRERSTRLSVDMGRPITPGPELFFLQREFYGLEESEWTYLRKDGSRVPVAMSVSRLLDEDGRHVGSVRVSIDITERKRSSDRIRQMAEHDALTGLLNRTSMQALLQDAVDPAEPGGQPFALMFIDLDGFKRINDTLGHEAGDELLKSVAQRLRECVRASDAVARMGGDEFVVLLRGITCPQEAAHVAEKVVAAVLRPHSVQLGRQGTAELGVGASVGITLCPRDGRDAVTLLRLADTAMYRAKHAGRSTWRMAEAEAAPA